VTDARALSFGAVAEEYERFRPGYPGEVADLVLDGLGDPASLTALEVGAGTGKATRMFASRGVAVTAVEPDAAMASVLTRVCAGLPVTTVVGSFEDIDLPDEPFDIVYAAAAWHWTDPGTRWSRAAALLRDGGVVAAIAGPVEVADAALAARIEEIDRRHAKTAVVWGEGEGSLRWPGDELAASPYFENTGQHEIELRSSLPADDYVGMIATVSSYVVMAPALRAQVLAEIRSLLPALVEVRSDLTVHRATRRSR